MLRILQHISTRTSLQSLGSARPLSTTAADVVIVGGGVVGSSIAYNLINDGFTGRVVVLERDDAYTRNSSALAMGGIRQQFSSKVNIEMAQYSVEFYKTLDAKMQSLGAPCRADLHQRGYLFLMNKENEASLTRRCGVQQRLGGKVELVDRTWLKQRLPDMNLEDIEGGVFGREDGYANPRGVLQCLRTLAMSRGAQFIHGEMEKVVRSSNGCVSGISYRPTGGDAVSLTEITTPVVVNAGGAFAGQVAERAGVSSPVQPQRQHLFRFALPFKLPYRLPMTIDPSGVHWRHNGRLDPLTGIEAPESEPDTITVACTHVAEPMGANFETDLTRWEKIFFPEMIRRFPLFAEGKLVRGWCGMYEMTPDHNPVIGEHPNLPGFFVANGFSGHGLMMSPATGKVISEMIRKGKAETVDVSDFDVLRFEKGKEFWDEAMI